MATSTKTPSTSSISASNGGINPPNGCKLRFQPWNGKDRWVCECGLETFDRKAVERKVLTECGPKFGLASAQPEPSASVTKAPEKPEEPAK